MCHGKNVFVKLRETSPLRINMGDDSDVHAKGNGVSVSKFNVSGSVQRCKLDDVHYVLGLK